MVDNVSHPKHYEGSTSIECIEAMQLTFGLTAVQNFCVCNAFKYVWRYKNKNGVEDLEKALWYLNYYVQLCKKHNQSAGHLEQVKELRKLITDKFSEV